MTLFTRSTSTHSSPRTTSPRRTTRLIASVAALACVPLMAVSGSGGADAAVPGPQPAAPSGRVALSWAALYMADDHNYSAAEATAMAKKFDLISAMPIALKKYSKSMRTTNPRLTLLAYANATLLRKSNAGGLPESAFAHSTSGARVSVPAFGSYLMETADPTWRRAANAQCTSRATGAGYQGCLVDMLGMGVFAKGYISTVPRNPSTGRTYTEAEYRARMISMAAYYRQASPTLVHVGNAVQNTYRYWNEPVNSRTLVASMPSAQMEDFLRGAGDAATRFPDAEKWKANVDIIADFESRGQTGLFTTKVWSGASSAQVAQWQKYSMASYLLAANGKSFFAFTRSRDKAGAMQTNVPYSMPKNIGMPTGVRTRLTSGAWTRTFVNGMSVVNPTSATVTVTLPRALKTLSGQTVTSVRLGPNSGEVLQTAAAFG